MKDLFLGLLIAVIGGLIAFILKMKQEQPAGENPKETTTDYSKSYQKKMLLTKNEWYEYKKLKKYAAQLGLQICPKVRLLDLIEPRKGEGNYMSLLGKIQSKHVDFVICDQDLRVKAILELDDNSHDQKTRKDRDAFVDEVLNGVGYTVIHTRSITETTLEALRAPEKAQSTQD